MDRAALTNHLKQTARGLGFDLAGACPAVPAAGVERLRQWLAQGFAGEMHYLAKREPAYEHPRHVLDGVRSLLVLAMNYRTAEPAVVQPGQGRISRYAWGADYHDLIHDRLGQLAEALRARRPRRSCGASSIRRRFWNASSRSWPAWAGSARTPWF